MTLWGGTDFIVLGLGAAILLLSLALRFWRGPVLLRLAKGRWAAQVARDLPFPIWKGGASDAGGDAPIWANDAFLHLRAEERARLLRNDARVLLDLDGASGWFQRHDMGKVGFALPCDDLVRAEDGLREMVQTMTQTFAQLPLGLAVFDRSLHLASFNPALAELTMLSPAFLSRRPSLSAMLDAMRDRSMVPEPRNWKDWRAKLISPEHASATGVFDDVWALPGGQTYRVTGRHHKGGSLALMIEDISTEIIRGRRYRASLALCQSVIDRMEEGVAVFAASGQLVMTNQAYSALWGHDPGPDMSNADIAQAAGQWRARSAPTPLWADLEAIVGHPEERRSQQGEVRLTDGRLVRCRCEPLTEGAMLVAFRPVAVEGPPRAISAESA